MRSPEAEHTNMASSSVAERQSHPSAANSTVFRAAFSCISIRPLQRRPRTLSEYSVLIGIGTTETVSSKAIDRFFFPVADEVFFCSLTKAFGLYSEYFKGSASLLVESFDIALGETTHSGRGSGKVWGERIPIPRSSLIFRSADGSVGAVEFAGSKIPSLAKRRDRISPPFCGPILEAVLETEQTEDDAVASCCVLDILLVNLDNITQIPARIF
mmetsp:Transcript_30804/g.41085  ORF Transcript_30804/g.41085 Transcript_30804/m.41085 type:complete len:214 (-) Transcript_30804:5-646(-)